MAFNDKFGYHELLHAAHIMASSWGDHIEGHGALESNPELKAEAERIGREVAGFYQTVAMAIDVRFGEDDYQDQGFADLAELCIMRGLIEECDRDVFKKAHLVELLRKHDEKRARDEVQVGKPEL